VPQRAIRKSFRAPIDPIQRAEPSLAAERGHQSFYELAVKAGVVRHNKICLRSHHSDLAIVESPAANRWARDSVDLGYSTRNRAGRVPQTGVRANNFHDTAGDPFIPEKRQG
jgi:hypothetical protein